MSNADKTCWECSKPLFGRIDKKFCNEGCRSTYYNRKHRETNVYVRRINKILKKNRDILAQINTSAQKRVTVKQLTKLGFDLEFYTNTYTTKTGKTYFFCYDLGYITIAENLLAVVEKKEYV